MKLRELLSRLNLAFNELRDPERRDLYLLKLDKTLSFGERKMLDTARGLLVKELSIAQAIDEESIASELEEMFAGPETAPEGAAEG